MPPSSGACPDCFRLRALIARAADMLHASYRAGRRERDAVAAEVRRMLWAEATQAQEGTMATMVVKRVDDNGEPAERGIGRTWYVDPQTGRIAWDVRGPGGGEALADDEDIPEAVRAALDAE